MIHHVFSIFDRAAGAYLPPFFLPAVGMATRTFKDCINSEDHQFGRNPHDYTLFLLGNFDDQKGTFDMRETKESLGNGLEFVQVDRGDKADLFPDPAEDSKTVGSPDAHTPRKYPEKE